MKKLISVLLSILLILSVFVVNASAYSAIDGNTLDNYGISIVKLKAKALDYSKEETAKAILNKAGMSANEFKMLNANKYDEVIDSFSITKSSEYCKLSQDGTETHLTEKQFENALKEINSLNNIASTNSVESYAYSGTDSYFIKNLYVVKTKNAAKGTYGIIATYEWKNFGIVFHRLLDVISLSGENLVFDASSFSLSVYKKSTENLDGKVTYNETNEYYNFSNYSSKITPEDFAIACKYQLPLNIINAKYSLTYTDLSFLMTCSSRTLNHELATNFNVYSNYFHQAVVPVSSISISIEGASVSVNPSYTYRRYQITSSSPITYIP